MQQNSPLISVIIPTRNRFEYLTLMLNDLKNQDFNDFEVIVVDQSDNPKPLKDCLHIITDTSGPCVSRNIGAKAAKGEVLVFLDDDARINPDFIHEITTPIIDDRFDAVSGAICDPKGKYLKLDSKFLSINNENFIKVLTSNPDGDTSRISLAFSAGCGAVNKRVFNLVDGFDERFDPTGAGEDRELALKLYSKGFSIWYNAKAKLLHSIAPIGGSRGVGSRSLMMDVHTYWMCQKHFSEKLSIELKKTILKKYQLDFYEALKKMKHIRSKFKLLKEIKTYLS